MGELEIEIEKTTDTSVLCDFYCGVQGLDDLFHSSRFQNMVAYHLTNLYTVYMRGELVGLFSISSNNLILNSTDFDFMKMGSVPKPDIDIHDESFWERDSYPAVEIDYLAVRKEYRKGYRKSSDVKVGMLLMDAIIDMVENDNKAAAMSLVVDALCTREDNSVGFYQKCGFVPSERAREQAQWNNSFTDVVPATQRMYRILIPPRN